MTRNALVGILLIAMGTPEALAQAASATTPVLVTADQECVVSVDGEDVGTVAAGGTKKLQLARGEHLFSATCAGRPWKQVVSVGGEQKVVSISLAAAATSSAPAAPQPVAASASTGVARVLDRSGRLVVGAVVKDSPAWAAGVRAGSIIVSVDGKKAQELTIEALGAMDAGAPGSTLSAEILTPENEFRKVAIVRASVATSGTMQVMLPDGKTIQEKPFTPATFDAVAGTGAVFAFPGGTLVPGTWSGQGLTCDRCHKKARVGGSMYCEDHKCQFSGCKNLEAWPSNYCWLHKGLYNQ